MLSKTNLSGKTISRQIYNTKSKNLPTNGLTLVDMNTLVILILYCYSKWKFHIKDNGHYSFTRNYPSPMPSPTRGEGTFPPLMGGIKGG